MTWQEIWNDIINMQPGIAGIALRLACAMLVGALIGVEREFTHRPAGLRTHILVALGACAVSITGEMLFRQYSAVGALPDPARLSAQVITGVGFLGAGTIMKEGVNVKGLTTAASVWAVACLGIASGFGYYALALLGAAFILFTLTLVEGLQHRFIRAGGSEEHYALETEDVSTALTQLYTVAHGQYAVLTDLLVEQTAGGHIVSFQTKFYGRRHKRHHARFFAALVAIPGVHSVTNGTEASV